GFYHLHGIKGDVEESTLKYLIRNHDRKLFDEQKAYMEQVANFLNTKYAGDWVKVEIKDSYRNMKEVFKDKMHIIDLAKNALANLGLEAKFVPIRGGTDGANLSFMGLPCPNLGAGGYNFHSRFEYLSINELEKSVKLILEIIKLVK
ncbi:M20/M25/M40 family metallo-hydrolase, partial [bacterium]|nr:M20/M25/M40 family metallo-hydrolase [bacterium]